MILVTFLVTAETTEKPNIGYNVIKEITCDTSNDSRSKEEISSRILTVLFAYAPATMLTWLKISFLHVESDWSQI